MIVYVLGGLATGLAAVFLIPQMIRLVISRDASGVSMTWAVFGVITNLAWVVYLAAGSRWLPVLAPLMAVASYSVLTLAIRRTEIGQRWTGCVAYSCVLVVALILGGTRLLGTLLVLTPAVQLVPEVVAVYRLGRPSGVSPLTWGLSTGEAVCWAGYGWLTGEAALIGYGLMTSIGSILILARWWTTCGRRQGPRPSSATSTRPSLIAAAAASPRLAAVSLRRIFET